MQLRNFVSTSTLTSTLTSTHVLLVLFSDAAFSFPSSVGPFGAVLHDTSVLHHRPSRKSTIDLPIIERRGFILEKISGFSQPFAREDQKVHTGLNTNSNSESSRSELRYNILSTHENHHRQLERPKSPQSDPISSLEEHFRRSRSEFDRSDRRPKPKLKLPKLKLTEPDAKPTMRERRGDKPISTNFDAGVFNPFTQHDSEDLLRQRMWDKLKADAEKKRLEAEKRQKILDSPEYAKWKEGYEKRKSISEEQIKEMKKRESWKKSTAQQKVSKRDIVDDHSSDDTNVAGQAALERRAVFDPEKDMGFFQTPFGRNAHRIQGQT